MGHYKGIIAFTLVILGVVALFAGVALEWALFPGLFRSELLNNLDFKKGTKGWDAFVSRKFFAKFFFFNFLTFFFMNFKKKLEKVFGRKKFKNKNKMLPPAEFTV